MFCNRCGKEIPDQAQFCNYCGAPVNKVQPKPAPAPQPAPQPQPKKQKSNIGGRIIGFIITGVIALGVFLGVRYFTENVIFGKPEVPAPSSSSSSSEIIEVPKASLTDACIYGAVYEYGFLTYGLTELMITGYSYLSGEGDEPDALLSPDENTLFSCTKQLEIMDISFNASNEEGMIASFGEDSSTTLIDYQKYYMGDYPVIRYIAKTDVFGPERYFGELIIFPAETANETIRLQMYSTVEVGYDEINVIFDTLHIIPAEFAPTAENGTIGFNRITVK